jgi:hypothetical protein
MSISIMECPRFSYQIEIQDSFSNSGKSFVGVYRLNPQTDGQTERTNRVLEEVLRHFIDGDHVAWEDLLPIVTLTMNNSKSSSTGQSPFFLNHGRHLVTPISVDIPKENVPSLDTVFTDLKDTISKIKLLFQAAQDR